MSDFDNEEEKMETDAEVTEEKEPVPVSKRGLQEPKGLKAARITAVVLLAVIALAGIFLGVVSGILRFAIAGMMFGIIAEMLAGRVRKSTVIQMAIVLGIYMLVMSKIQVVSVDTSCAWIYPLQRDYISTLRNTVEPEWFPDEMENITGDFNFTYNMGFQDPGYYSVAYETTPEYIRELEKKYRPVSETALDAFRAKYGMEATYDYNENESFWGVGYDSDYNKTNGYGEYHEVFYIEYRNTNPSVQYGDSFDMSDVLILDISENENGEQVGRVEFRGH